MYGNCARGWTSTHEIKRIYYYYNGEGGGRRKKKDGGGGHMNVKASPSLLHPPSSLPVCAFSFPKWKFISPDYGYSNFQHSSFAVIFVSHKIRVNNSGSSSSSRPKKHQATTTISALAKLSTPLQLLLLLLLSSYL